MGGVDIFVMKLDPSGSITWLTQLGSTTNAGGSNTGNDACNSVAVDSSDNIYCAGYTTGAPGTTDVNAGGGGDIAIYKFDPSGTILSMVQFGDTTGFGSNTGFDSCNSVAVDSNDNVYCGGATNGNFGEATNTGTSDAFIAKFDSTLSPIWLTQLGSTTIAPGGDNTAGDNCKSIAVDPNDNVYCAGFTDGNQGEANSNSSSDTTIFKLDSAGNLKWLHQFGSESNAGGDNTAIDQCYGIAIDNNGNIFCGGFTDGAMGNEANAGTSDIIIFSLDQDGGF